MKTVVDVRREARIHVAIVEFAIEYQKYRVCRPGLNKQVEKEYARHTIVNQRGDDLRLRPFSLRIIFLRQTIPPALICHSYLLQVVLQHRLMEVDYELREVWFGSMLKGNVVAYPFDDVRYLSEGGLLHHLVLDGLQQCCFIDSRLIYKTRTMSLTILSTRSKLLTVLVCLFLAIISDGMAEVEFLHIFIHLLGGPAGHSLSHFVVLPKSSPVSGRLRREIMAYLRRTKQPIRGLGLSIQFSTFKFLLSPSSYMRFSRALSKRAFSTSFTRGRQSLYEPYVPPLNKEQIKSVRKEALQHEPKYHARIANDLDFVLSVHISSFSQLRNLINWYLKTSCATQIHRTRKDEARQRMQTVIQAMAPDAKLKLVDVSLNQYALDVHDSPLELIIEVGPYSSNTGLYSHYGAP